MLLTDSIRFQIRHHSWDLSREGMCPDMSPLEIRLQAQRHIRDLGPEIRVRPVAFVREVQKRAMNRSQGSLATGSALSDFALEWLSEVRNGKHGGSPNYRKAAVFFFDPLAYRDISGLHERTIKTIKEFAPITGEVTRRYDNQKFELRQSPNCLVTTIERQKESPVYYFVGKGDSDEMRGIISGLNKANILWRADAQVIKWLHALLKEEEFWHNEVEFDPFGLACSMMLDLAL